eukprot:scaffold85958_cov35-Attheya_sp.AAC.1
MASCVVVADDTANDSTNSSCRCFNCNLATVANKRHTTHVSLLGIRLEATREVAPCPSVMCLDPNKENKCTDHFMKVNPQIKNRVMARDNVLNAPLDNVP